MTNLLVASFSLKMAEHNNSEAKSAKQGFASNKTYILICGSKLRFALFASLRSAIFSENEASN
jgi:hypothetical protein